MFNSIIKSILYKNVKDEHLGIRVLSGKGETYGRDPEKTSGRDNEQAQTSSTPRSRAQREIHRA